MHHAYCTIYVSCKKNDFLPLWFKNEDDDVVVAPVEDNVLSDAQSIRDAPADLFSGQ